MCCPGGPTDRSHPHRRIAFSCTSHPPHFCGRNGALVHLLDLSSTPKKVSSPPNSRPFIGDRHYLADLAAHPENPWNRAHLSRLLCADCSAHSRPFSLRRPEAHPPSAVSYAASSPPCGPDISPQNPELPRHLGPSATPAPRPSPPPNLELHTHLGAPHRVD